MTLPSIGDVVDDKFRIERKLGEGGTSTIYEVRHTVTDKKFALKWLAPQLAANDLAIQLLFHEAKISGRFVHPNAVQIYDICRTADSCYLLMEFLEGESLEARLLREQRLSVEATCDILLPCIEALSAAHRVGIIHRDLKPSNIFLSRVDGGSAVVPKVLDFGISNYVHGGHDVSPTSAGSGTPLYMAPEQVWAQPADPRFDIYALGVVLYELVSGQPPFDGTDFDDLVNRIVESEPPRLTELVDVDSRFAAVVARAMARGSADRFATMAELASALRPFSSQRVRGPSGAAGAAANLSARPALRKQIDTPAPAARRALASTAIGVGIHDPAAEDAALAAQKAVPASEPAVGVPRLATVIIEDDVASEAAAQAAPSEISDVAAAVASDESADPPIPSLSAAVAPPIVLPPPRAAAPRTTAISPWSEDDITSHTPWRADDVFAHPAAVRAVRGQGARIGLGVALGGALLLTLYALTRESDVAVSSNSNSARLQGAQQPAPVIPEPEPEPEPEVVILPPSVQTGVDEAEERRDRAERRAARRAARKVARETRLAHNREREHSARKTSSDDADDESAVESALLKRPSQVANNSFQRERAAASESDRRMPLPAAGISRQDF